jgi:hypothetical protein
MGRKNELNIVTTYSASDVEGHGADKNQGEMPKTLGQSSSQKFQPINKQGKL